MSSYTRNAVLQKDIEALVAELFSENDDVCRSVIASAMRAKHFQHITAADWDTIYLDISMQLEEMFPSVYTGKQANKRLLHALWAVEREREYHTIFFENCCGYEWENDVLTSLEDELAATLRKTWSRLTMANRAYMLEFVENLVHHVLDADDDTEMWGRLHTWMEEHRDDEASLPGDAGVFADTAACLDKLRARRANKVEAMWSAHLLANVDADDEDEEDAVLSRCEIDYNDYEEMVACGYGRKRRRLAH